MQEFLSKKVIVLQKAATRIIITKIFSKAFSMRPWKKILNKSNSGRERKLQWLNRSFSDNSFPKKHFFHGLFLMLVYRKNREHKIGLDFFQHESYKKNIIQNEQFYWLRQTEEKVWAKSGPCENFECLKQLEI